MGEKLKREGKGKANRERKDKERAGLVPCFYMGLHKTPKIRK